MNPAALRNLTLASAKHLVSQGHISSAHHAKILKKAKIKAAPGPMPAMKLADETGPGAFGSLNPIQGAGAGHYMGSMPDEGMGGGSGV